MAQPQPPMSGDDQDADEAYGGDPSSQPQQGDGGYVIEIHVDGNKQISVCVESAADEAAEESGAGGDADDGSGSGGDDDNSTPVKSIKEALTLALEIFRNNGQLPQQADDQFQQGFQGANQ